MAPLRIVCYEIASLLGDSGSEPVIFHTLKRTARLVLVATCFLAFWAGSSIFSWIFLPLFVAFRRDRELVARRTQRIIQIWFVGFWRMMRLFGGFDYDTRTQRVQHGHAGPVVYVANHPTLVDVIALMATYPNVACVIKGSVYDGFAVGRLLRYGAQINGDTPTGAELQRVLDECADRIRRGYSVLIFPESTRSPIGGLHPFHRIAFEVASRADVPLVPIHLECHPPVLMRGTPWHAFPDERVHYAVTELPTRRVGRGRTQVVQAMKDVQALLASESDRKRMNRAHESASNAEGTEEVRAYV